MTALADRTITALRELHDELAELVPTLTDAQLTGHSGAAEWSVAQVLSHLGSGSEISLASIRPAIDGTPDVAPDFNQSVWDRWNAMSPQDQASGFLEHDEILVATLEALTPEQRESLQVKIGFLPAPLDLAATTGMRLNETANHTWDVQVAVDPAAAVSEDVASVLLDQFAGGIGFLLGFVGKADQLSHPALVDIDGYGLVIADGVSVTATVDHPTATFNGTMDAAVRLISGRLTPAHTPEGLEVEGNVTLDDLRRVFPGF